MKGHTHYLYLIKLGFPIAIGQLGIIILGFADTMMVGHYNTSSLAAASFVNNFFTFVICFILGYSNGITPLVGSVYGKGKYVAAGKKFRQTFNANILYGILIFLLATILYFFLGDMGQPVELLPLIRSYYIVILFSMVFVLIFNLFKQFTDCITDTKIGMRITIVGNGLNIVLNYFFIFGIGPFPEWGLFGAGISTLIARFIMAVSFILIFLYKKDYKEYREGFKTAIISVRTLKQINKHSLPLSIQMGMESAAYFLTAIMAGWIGAVELASYEIIMTIGVIGFLLYSSFGTSMAIRISNFMGQDDWENINNNVTAGRNMLLVLAACISVLFYFLGQPLIMLFTKDAEVIASASSLILPLIAYQMADGFQVCYINALRGTGHVLSMMGISFISYILISIPVGYILAFVVGLDEVGLFLAFSVGIGSAAILYYMKMRKVLKTQSNGLKR